MPATEAAFLQRPAHTQAEDWIIYHPEMTATALMLYMRLRGAVMDPSSSAAGWKKTTRFTVDQMRMLLPRTKTTGVNEGGDPYASIRTARMALSHLVSIGALRRIQQQSSQVPVYDFPMYPPDGHTGPVWGGDVATDLRIGEKDGNALPGRQPIAGGEAMHCRGGGNLLPHEGGVTRADGAPEEAFKEKSSSSSKKGPRAGAHDEEEDAERRQAEAIRKARVTEESEEILSACLEKIGVQMQGRDRRTASKAVSALLSSSWTQARIDGLFAHTKWREILVPDRYVLNKIKGAVGTVHVATPAEADSRSIAVLKEQIAAQKEEIAACDGCGPYGRPLDGRQGTWHGHGEPDLKDRLYVLENPAEAAQIAELNNASRKS